MLRRRSLFFLITAFGMLLLGANYCLAQGTIAEYQRVGYYKAVFSESDFAALDQGETVTRVLPTRDKREIAVYGMVRTQAPAEVFLQSFRENMTRKNNQAILEIGSFRNSPTLDDLNALTIEDRDIEDLRQCVVGDCRVKLSEIMIERMQREVDWAAPNYRTEATQVLKQMLVDYVRDYLSRGRFGLRLTNRLKGKCERLLKSKSGGECPCLVEDQVWSKTCLGYQPHYDLQAHTARRRGRRCSSRIETNLCKPLF
jgi:hypothetical protein